MISESKVKSAIRIILNDTNNHNTWLFAAISLNEIKEKLSARRNEIITVAMGKCWHVKSDLYSPTWQECKLCGYGISTLADKVLGYGVWHPSYDFNSIKWFELFNWLTKEKRSWWNHIKLYGYESWRAKWVLQGLKQDAMSYINENLSQLFVEWLWTKNIGCLEECPALNCSSEECKENPECAGTGNILTPLGKLMKEVR